MNKKIIILGLAILLILFLAIYIFIGWTKILPPANKPSPSATPVVQKFPTATVTNMPLPSGMDFSSEKMEVAGITINNIYKNNTGMNRDYDIQFFKNENYELVFLSHYQKFIITIVGSPFQMYIKPAEEEFIKALGISKEQACNLNVEIGTVIFANPDYAGKTYLLSFCRNK